MAGGRFPSDRQSLRGITGYTPKIEGESIKKSEPQAAPSPSLRKRGGWARRKGGENIRANTGGGGFSEQGRASMISNGGGAL
eukprot:scaffold66907_cov31-Tisochrysis_lutea.AAC.2